VEKFLGAAPLGKPAETLSCCWSSAWVLSDTRNRVSVAPQAPSAPHPFRLAPPYKPGGPTVGSREPQRLDQGAATNVHLPLSPVVPF
jgi:hypothetical protein